MLFINSRRVIPVLLCLFVAATAANAAPDTPTLASAIRAGYERNPELALTGAIRDQSSAIRQQAESLLAADPSVMLRHESDAATGSDGYRYWEGGLEMPLWLPGQRHRRSQVALAMENEADSTSRFQEWNVAGEIRELLWSLRIAETRLELARRAVQSARSLEVDVSKRVDAGELPRNDLVIVQAETLAREVDQTAAASNRDILLSSYRLATGLAVPPVVIVEEKTHVAGISEDHPALQNALVAARRAYAERDQVRGEKWSNPHLTIGSKTERPGSGWSYDTALIVQVNVPLGTASHAAPGIAAAERQLAEVKSAALTVQRDLEKALIRATGEIQQSERALKLSEQQQHLTAEGLRLTRRAFELGESDLYTLLQARKRALETELDLRMRRDELGRAVSRYNQALGVVPQ